MEHVLIRVVSCMFNFFNPIIHLKREPSRTCPRALTSVFPDSVSHQSSSGCFPKKKGHHRKRPKAPHQAQTPPAAPLSGETHIKEKPSRKTGRRDVRAWHGFGHHDLEISPILLEGPPVSVRNSPELPTTSERPSEGASATGRVESSDGRG